MLACLGDAPDEALAEGGALHSWIGAIMKSLTTDGGQRRELSDFQYMALKTTLRKHPKGPRASSSPGGVALAQLRPWLRSPRDR